MIVVALLEINNYMYLGHLMSLDVYRCAILWATIWETVTVIIRALKPTCRYSSRVECTLLGSFPIAICM